MNYYLPQDTVSDRFCKDDSDITFRSCDGTLFKVHRKNLETASEGFSPPEGTTAQTEVVSLTEDGKTLELLFQYMYPQRHPDLTKVDFKQLAELAEAAEKYQVYGTMDTCNTRMSEAYSDHPFEVMMYAMKHGYVDLMDKSERKALELSPTTAFECFTPQVYIAWTRYYAQWMDLLASLQRALFGLDGHIMGYHINNHGHTKWMLWVIGQLDRPAALLKLDSFWDPSVYGSQLQGVRHCDYCKGHLERWRDRHMKEEIGRMKKLSSFLQ